jgi:hypothetical protein
VRLLDLSRSGCRLESSRRIEAGTSGRLRVGVNGSTRTDDVRISRCQPREGAGGTYDVGAELLLTRTLGPRSLRSAVSELTQPALVLARTSEPRFHLSGAGQVEEPVRSVSRAPPQPALSES